MLPAALALVYLERELLARGVLNTKDLAPIVGEEPGTVRDHLLNVWHWDAALLLFFLLSLPCLLGGIWILTRPPAEPASGTRTPADGHVTASPFEAFREVFDLHGGAPGYLPLLQLHSAEAAHAVEQVRRAIAAGATNADVGALLTDVNWRAHLVGAIALLFLEDPEPSLTPAWNAIDAGSWVTPQLVVCLFYVDTNFPAKARRRLDTGCSVDPPRDLAPMATHIATGPAGAAVRSAQMTASLLAMCTSIPMLRDWTRATGESAAIRARLAKDIYDSTELTRGWQRRLCALFASHGRALVSPWERTGADGHACDAPEQRE